MSSGLPVHHLGKKLALADFIVKNQVGLTVENLAQLDEILSELTPGGCITKCVKNVAKVAHKMRFEGLFPQAAVTKLEYEVTK